MSYKILIIEDDTKASNYIRDIISSNFEEIDEIRCASSYSQALLEINEFKPNIVTLDIELDNKQSGFKLLKEVRQNEFHLIFITAYKEYAIDAFQELAIGYILKPIHDKLLIETIKQAIGSINTAKRYSQIEKWLMQNENFSNSENKKLSIYSQGQVFFIDVNEIIIVKADGSYSEVLLNNGKKILVSKNLTYMELQLQKTKFLRLHRSYIINIDAVVKMKRNKNGAEISLLEGITLDVSRESAQLLMEKLSINPL